MKINQMLKQKRESSSSKDLRKRAAAIFRRFG